MEPRPDPPRPAPPPLDPLPDDLTYDPDFIDEKPDTGTRFLAKFIDGLIAAVLSWIVAVVVPGWFTGALMGGLAAAAYLLVSDGLDVDFMQRRSLGKKMMNLDVRRLDGAAMDIETSARRNWMFVLGYLSSAFTYRAAGLAWLISLAGLGLFIYEVYRVITSDDGRRWGDELAETEVVKV